MAESMTNPEAKQMMLDVAADYERLAKRAEEERRERGIMNEGGQRSLRTHQVASQEPCC